MQELADEYEVLAHQSWKVRARRLPMLVGRLFERGGYEAQLRAAAATPRDADLMASALDEHYLVEVKSGAKPAGIEVVDELRVRLQVLPPYVTGVIVSANGFTAAAVKQVIGQRDRPMVLIAGGELTELFSGRLGLRSLLRHKKADLMRDAAVRFFDKESPVQFPGPTERGRLPQPNVRVTAEDAAPSAVSMLGERGGDFVFTDELPDVDWTISLGVGAGLDVDLELRSLDELAGAFELLRRRGWLTPDGRWAIHQTPISWHGAGAETLLTQLRDQRARYTAVGHLRMHGSEQVVYFDRCDGGLYSLVLRVLTGDKPQIFESQLSVQLPGIPLDPSNTLMILRELGVDDGAVFRSLAGQQRMETAAFRLGEVPVEVVGQIQSLDRHVDSRTWIRGLIVRNPFRGRLRAKLPTESAHALGEPELLLCSLSSWYTIDAAPRNFSIVRIEAVRTASAVAFRFVANWASELL